MTTAPAGHVVPGTRLGPVGDRTFALLFLAAYGALLVHLPGSDPPSPPLLTTAAGGLYVLIGTVGFARVEQLATLAPALAYFAVQLLLGSAVSTLVGGEIGAVLMLLLLCGQAVRVLPRPSLVVAVAVLVTVILLVTPPVTKWIDALQYGVGILAAAYFMVAFAQVAVGEQRQRAALDRANARLRAYAAEAEQMATIQERYRLAREIHDGLGHYLTVINMQLEGARAVLPHDQGRAERMLTRAQTLARETLADVRHSVGALRTGQQSRRPLPEALSAMADEVDAAAGGPQVGFEVRGRPRPLPPQAELALYCAAQEGLTNARKHAAATRADLLLDYGDPACVCLSVQDNGRGATTTDGGFGLLGLRERVGLLGGTIEVQTGPAAGLALIVQIPA
jgi:signal transduction histidine kinase